MRWFVSCLLLLIHQYCMGQQYYETYTPANGLVDARVNKMMQDARGRILFLTRDGISLFDGQRFINHTKIGDNTLGIIEDGILLPDGNIQLASFNGKWITLQKNSNAPDTAMQKGISEVSSIITLNDKEQLIVSNYGLFIQKKSGLFPFLISNFSNGQRNVFENLTPSGRSLIFSTRLENGQVLYSCFKNAGFITDSMQSPLIYSIAVDKKQRIYACTEKGILQLDHEMLQQGKLRVHTPWFQQYLPGNYKVDKLFFDRQENIWLINYTQGCRKINTATSEVTSYSPADGLFTGVTSIFQDNENNYWFIAKGIGVQKLVQTNYELLNKFGAKPLEIVYALSSTNDNSLAAFTSKNILLLKDNSCKEILKRDYFDEVSFFWQNALWKYPSTNNIISELKQRIKFSNTISTNSLIHFPSPHITPDKKGNLLLAGNHFVMVKPDYTATSFSLPYFADNIVDDGNNQYWAFCRSNDVVKFVYANNKLEKKASFVYPDLETRFALHWNKDTFLLASRSKGMLVVKVNDTSLSVINKFTRKEGLSNDFVETLLKIDTHRIAAGTAAGLDIITFTDTDTLIENISARINHFEPILQLARDDKGMIYARTETLQLFKYNPFNSSANIYHPGAWINQLIVNGKPVLLTKRKFSHLENNLFFSASSPSFINNRNIVFHFMLKGEKAEWSQKSNKADFEIDNLSPGKYQLTIAVKYPGNIYPDNNIIYDFTINPPFWQTWWFITSLAIALVFLTWAFTRSYLQRQLQKQTIIMEKELAIEQERIKMARELHDGLGSMLSGVKHSFTAMKNQVMLNEEQEKKFQYNIGKLNESITELRDISHSMASESLLKYGLINSLQDFCRNISQPGFSISFAALHTENIQLADDESFHLFRIVQELFQNIVKHSGATEAILQLSYNNNRLYITIEDNGKGFEWNDPQHKKGMGLKNIETRIKTLKGKMDYRTAPAKGTSVLIEIPCSEKKL